VWSSVLQPRADAPPRTLLSGHISSSITCSGYLFLIQEPRCRFYAHSLADFSKAAGLDSVVFQVVGKKMAMLRYRLIWGLAGFVGVARGQYYTNITTPSSSASSTTSGATTCAVETVTITSTSREHCTPKTVTETCYETVTSTYTQRE